MVRLLPLVLVLAACPAPTVDEAACAEICAQAGGEGGQATPQARGAAPTPAAAETRALTLSTYEAELLGDMVQDVRAGVRPFDDQSIGICPKPDKSRGCDEMLGMNPGELPEGEYVLHSSFKVPQAGERGTWTVKVDVDCEVTQTGDDGSTSTKTSTWSKEFDVVYAGVERGYTLSPLRRITSPHPLGPQACTFTITAPHPDGDKVYEGAWSLPGPAEAG